MLNNIIVVGDIHLREKEPYYTQGRMFLKWLFESEHNSNKNILLLLGDIVERINATHELLEIYLDYFLNKSNFKEIWILQGNHDTAIIKDSYNQIQHSTVLSVFNPLKNVKIIKKAMIFDLTQDIPLRMLFLPHYDPVSDMIKEYSSINDNNEFDYCFHHIEDETQHFGKSYVNLSSLNVKNYLCGHIHNETITKGGHYLGSPTFNSKNEKDKIPYIAVIDVKTKKYNLLKVPIFITYKDISYPNKIEKEDIITIYTIFDSIDKQTTIEYYKEQAKELDSVFYYRRIFNKQIKNDNFSISEKSNEKSIIDYFNDYCTKNNLVNDIQIICKDVLQTQGEL